jgi:hypothetical protein
MYYRQRIVKELTDQTMEKTLVKCVGFVTTFFSFQGERETWGGRERGSYVRIFILFLEVYPALFFEIDVYPALGSTYKVFPTIDPLNRVTLFFLLRPETDTSASFVKFDKINL